MEGLPCLDLGDSADDKDETPTPRPASQEEVRRPRHKKVKGRPSKSQPSSNQEVREVTSALKMRPTRSAPQRRTRAASPKRTPLIRSRQGGDKTRQDSGLVSDGGDLDEESHQTSSGDEGQGRRPRVQEELSSSDSPGPMKGFRAMKGSVTSEEEDTDKEQQETGQRKEGKRKVKPAQHCVDEDPSSYSDAMTIASSDGLSDLPASPLAKMKDFPLNLSQSGNSGVSATPRSSRDPLQQVVKAPKIQFDLVTMKVSRDTFDHGSSSSSPTHRRGDIPLRHSSASQRKGSLVIHYDLREYLSDAEPRRPTFSQESRARLVGRVENAISPDLKHKLMSGDPALMVQSS